MCVCVCVWICFELAKIGLDLIEPNNQYIYIYIYTYMSQMIHIDTIIWYDSYDIYIYICLR